MNLLNLYLIFLKISVFTFGGGYAMIPLFQDELVVKGHFLDNAQFANLVALAQMTPGPIGLNAATYIGYGQGGVIGATVCTLGLITPAFVITLLAAVFLQKAKDNPILKNTLLGIRPAVLGLIAAAVIFFADTSVFTAPLHALWTKDATFGICWQGLLIFAITIVLSARFKLNLLAILAISAALGIVLL